jgi:GNAT superfamily N-acetyltransferase
MALTLIECTDKERWDRFTEESPHGSIFCLTPFLDALEEEYRLFLVEEEGEAQAGVVLILHGGQPFPGQYPLTMYQGVLLGVNLCRQPPYRRAPQTLEVLDFLLTELEKRYDRIVVCQHHRFEDLRAFSLFQFDGSERGEFRIDLQYSGLLDLALVADFDQYLGSIRTVRRQEYRRCQASGFCISLSQDLELLDWLHDLTFARQGIDRPAEAVRTLRSISRAALSQGFGELSTCVAPDGTVASATLFLFDRSCAYYWVAANHPAFRKTGCGTYLMIENLRHWQEKGLAAVDFVGINSPNRGDFKTSFNAVPIPYFLATWERPKRSHPANLRVDQSRRGYSGSHLKTSPLHTPSGNLHHAGPGQRNDDRELP